MVEENKNELAEKIIVREIKKTPLETEDLVDFGAESVRSPEQAQESLEQVKNIGENPASDEASGSKEIGGIVAAGKAAQAQNQQIKEIEDILQDENVVEAYLAMPPSQRKAFKIAGEETARKINELMGKTKVNVKKIVDLIRKWLSMIPGVNVFFLEQEAKIKTDEIIKTREEKQ